VEHELLLPLLQPLELLHIEQQHKSEENAVKVPEL
jgi:hypothetical protein